jgi:dolichol kinase
VLFEFFEEASFREEVFIGHKKVNIEQLKGVWTVERGLEHEERGYSKSRWFWIIIIIIMIFNFGIKNIRKRKIEIGTPSLSI